MNSDSQIVRELRSALDDEAENLRVPPGAAQRARTRARRRRTARGLLAGVPVVALAAGLVIAAQSRTPGPATSATGTASSPAAPAPSRQAGAPRVETAAYVTKHVEAALANVDSYIVRETTNSYPGGTYTSWTDPRTGSAYATQGTGSRKVLSWNSSYFLHRVLRWRTTEADYSSHTWFVSVIHAAGPVQGPLPKPAVGGVLSAAQLRKALQKGVMRVVGHGYINGRPATALKARIGIVALEVWVDAQTFQPVREIRGFGGRLKGALVFNESWAARTPGLVSLANHPQIPAGFTQVPAPK